MIVGSNANTIQNFGVDPTSSAGAFSHSLAGGAFDDQYTFSLDHPMTLTIASVTNTFAQLSDFIANFSGEVVSGTPSLPGPVVIGPVMASACSVPACQGFAGTAFLDSGNYFLDISGVAGATAGYGGNLSTFAVPGPIVGAGLPGMIAGCIGLVGLARLRRRK
jgi:hypothetical protein